MNLLQSLSSVALAIGAGTVMAHADARPDFEDNAVPILRQQPGLVQYVKSHFDVKDTGTAKAPGDDNRPAQPPYIFQARNRGSEGPYNLRLLIQPGQPGHILGVVDITKVHMNGDGAPSRESAPRPKAPSVAKNPATMAPAPAPANAPSPAPAPAQTSPSVSEPTADTPSGPIGAPSLAPPPDPSQGN